VRPLKTAADGDREGRGEVMTKQPPSHLLASRRSIECIDSRTTVMLLSDEYRYSNSMGTASRLNDSHVNDNE
jgi:hypothetical protein